MSFRGWSESRIHEIVAPRRAGILGFCALVGSFGNLEVEPEIRRYRRLEWNSRRSDERVRRPLVNESPESQAGPEAGSTPARSRFCQERRPEHSSVVGVEAIVPIRNRRFRCMVLLG